MKRKKAETNEHTSMGFHVGPPTTQELLDDEKRKAERARVMYEEEIRTLRGKIDGLETAICAMTKSLVGDRE